MRAARLGHGYISYMGARARRRVQNGKLPVYPSCAVGPDVCKGAGATSVRRLRRRRVGLSS